MTDINRREFSKWFGAGLAAIPVVGITVASRSQAADDLPVVDPESAVAKQYQYMEVSDVADKHCSNCALYVAEEGAEMGKCALFPNSSVLAKAHCIAWAPKPA